MGGLAYHALGLSLWGWLVDWLAGYSKNQYPSTFYDLYVLLLPTQVLSLFAFLLTSASGLGRRRFFFL